MLNEKICITFVFPNPEVIAMDPPIWNRADLSPPPVCTVKSKWGKEMRVLNGALKKIITTLDYFDIMLYENKLLSNVIKHFKEDLRTDKSFQLVNRICHCLKKCSMLNIKEDFLKLEKTSTQCTAFDHQPSRQMLEYVLVRVLGFIMLLKFLVDLCHNCALHLRGKMEVGHFPAATLILFSIVSRLWSLSSYFMENSFEWYLLLLPLLQYLKPTQIDWLPSGYKFPAVPLESQQAPWINQEKILKSVSSFLAGFEKPDTPSTNLDFLTKADDLGETISRTDFVVPRRAEAKDQIKIQKRVQNEKSPVQNKVVLTQKTIRVTNRPAAVQKNSPSEQRKRKLFKSEPETVTSDIGEDTQPVKRFFKTNYSRPVTVQEFPISKHTPATENKEKILKMEPVPSGNGKRVKCDAVKEAGSDDISQELEKLKQDLTILAEKSRTDGSKHGLNPKLNKRVIVVQKKKLSTITEPPLKKRILDSDTQDYVVSQINKPVKKKSKDALNSAILVDTLNAPSRDKIVLPVMSDSRKKKVSKQIRLEKKKELVKLKKLKSKSWIVS